MERLITLTKLFSIFNQEKGGVQLSIPPSSSPTLVLQDTRSLQSKKISKAGHTISCLVTMWIFISSWSPEPYPTEILFSLVYLTNHGLHICWYCSSLIVYSNWYPQSNNLTRFLNLAMCWLKSFLLFFVCKQIINIITSHETVLMKSLIFYPSNICNKRINQNKPWGNQRTLGSETLDLTCSWQAILVGFHWRYYLG